MVKVARWIVLAGLGVCLASPRSALARSGESAPTIGSWDTRASSLSFAYLEGLFGAGHLRFASYFTNFTSTTGRLSSQFGLHYIGYGEEGSSSAHGMAGSATALYEIPLNGRQPNGLPWVALAPYIGLSPSAIVSGDYAAIALPAHFGVGLPISPISWLTVTPWVEGTAGLGLDLNVNRKAIDDIAAGTIKPADAKASDVLRFEYGPYLSSRFGLNLTAHLGARIDVQVQGLGNWLSQPANSRFVFMTGAAIAWHWDDVVPAVLPDNGCPVPGAASETSAGL